jgi:hypothetical protein
MSFKMYIGIFLRNDNSFIPISYQWCEWISIHTDWTFFLYFLSICFVFVVLSYCARREEGDWSCGCREIWPVCVYCAGSVHPVANQMYEGRKKEKDCWSSFFFLFQKLGRVVESCFSSLSTLVEIVWKVNTLYPFALWRNEIKHWNNNNKKGKEERNEYESG